MTFKWDMKTYQLVLWACVYGFLTTHIAGGIISQKAGGKLPILLGVSLASVFTLLTPILTTVWGFGAIFTLRFLAGMCVVRIGKHVAKCVLTRRRLIRSIFSLMSLYDSVNSVIQYVSEKKPFLINLAVTRANIIRLSQINTDITEWLSN